MSSLRPIEIVGGGLAGLSLGLALRREGVPVTLHEAGEYPRHRVCGEFIAGLEPRTIARLALAPVLADALAHRDVAWFIAGGPSRVQRLPSPALALSRHTLDARLAQAFTACGGVLRTNSRVVEAAKPPGRVFANGRRRAVDSRWIGLKVHVRALELGRELEVHLGDECYVGLTRIDPDTVNVCGLFRRRPLSLRGPRLLLEYLRSAGLETVAARLAAADIDEDSFCGVAAVAFDRRVRASACIRIGDAGAMIPPFTGNGMAMAFQSAECALDPLLAYARVECDWTAACRTTHAALRRRFRLRLASAGALHSFLWRSHRQRWLAVLGRARLLPFGPLYSTLH